MPTPHLVVATALTDAQLMLTAHRYQEAERLIALALAWLDVPKAEIAAKLVRCSLTVGSVTIADQSFVVPGQEQIQ